MDRVFIEALHVDAVIGHFDWEREIRQTLLLDIDMQFDCRAAGHSDALGDALDYAAVADAVTERAAQSNYHLLEALAEDLTRHILTDFACRSVRLTIRKPAAVGHAAAVGICIERQRDGA